MTLRRIASISFATLSFAFVMAGSTGCVVRSGPPAHGGARAHVHHHCHARICHSHPHKHVGPAAHRHR